MGPPYLCSVIANLRSRCRRTLSSRRPVLFQDMQEGARASVLSQCHTVPMEQRITLITLGVRDLGVSRSFYESLGWSGAQQHGDEVCFFQVGSMVFGLWTELGGHGAPGIELAYNVRTHDDVATTLA